VRRLVGDVPDLDVRADLGPAYLILHGMWLGRTVREDELTTLLNLTRQPATAQIGHRQRGLKA